MCGARGCVRRSGTPRVLAYTTISVYLRGFGCTAGIEGMRAGCEGSGTACGCVPAHGWQRAAGRAGARSGEVLLVDGQAALAELPAHPLEQLKRGRLNTLELVLAAEPLPLVDTHLVKRQHLGT